MIHCFFYIYLTVLLIFFRFRKWFYVSFRYFLSDIRHFSANFAHFPSSDSPVRKTLRIPLNEKTCCSSARKQGNNRFLIIFIQRVSCNAYSSVVSAFSDTSSAASLSPAVSSVFSRSISSFRSRSASKSSRLISSSRSSSSSI